MQLSTSNNEALPPDSHNPLDDAHTLAEVRAFWQEKLPRLGRSYNLTQLFSPVHDCNLCDNSGSYLRRDGEHIPCFCELQRAMQARTAQWQQYDYLPQRFKTLQRNEIFQIEGLLNWVYRDYYLSAVNAVDQFIENPRGNLILTGAVGSGRTILAAYIARQVAPVPHIFITVRQLIGLLQRASEHDDLDTVKQVFSTVPVLILDDFPADLASLDRAALDHLYDIIYRRWSDMLPYVVTSSADLRTLDDTHEAVFDRLRFDARIFHFEWGPVRLSAPTVLQLVTEQRANTTATAPRNRCPYLGVHHDADTWIATPSNQNYCYQPSEPQKVAATHQTERCLSESYHECPVYQAMEPLEGELPPDIRFDETWQVAGQKQSDLAISVVGSLMIVGGMGLLAWLLATSGMLSLLAGSQAAAPAATATAPPAIVASSQAAPEPSATVIVEDSAVDFSTAAPTPAPTQAPAQTVSLAYGTNLRLGPATDYGVIAYLEPGTAVALLGRDELGVWLKVSTPDEAVGWVASTQIADEIEVLALVPQVLARVVAPIGPRLTLAYDSNLRQGPGMAHDVLDQLSGGVHVWMLGRDEYGNWSLVETESGATGWVATSQIAEEIDILAYPISREEIIVEAEAALAEADATAQPPWMLQVDPTTEAAAQLPAQFIVTLQSRDVTGCYADIQARYQFTISDRRLAITRLDDSTTTVGQFTPSTGAFSTAGNHAFGYEELFGTIELDDDGTVTVSGTQLMAYDDEESFPCEGEWELSGELATSSLP